MQNRSWTRKCRNDNSSNKGHNTWLTFTLLPALKQTLLTYMHLTIHKYSMILIFLILHLYLLFAFVSLPPPLNCNVMIRDQNRLPRYARGVIGAPWYRG